MTRSALLMACLLLAACGQGPGPVVPGAAGEPGPGRTVATAPWQNLVPDGYDGPFGTVATVLQSPAHGPQLCLGAVMESYPPQCGGMDVVGWDWAGLDEGGYDSAAGTTWGTFFVVGTVDGDTFTLTGPPRPPEAAAGVLTSPPQPRSPGTPGTPGAARTEAQLERIQEELLAREDLLSAGTDVAAGQVEVVVPVATEEDQRELDSRYGPGVVRLVGRLQPVQR